MSAVVKNLEGLWPTSFAYKDCRIQDCQDWVTSSCDLPRFSVRFIELGKIAIAFSLDDYQIKSVVATNHKATHFDASRYLSD